MSNLFQKTGYEDRYIKRLTEETARRSEVKIVNVNGINVSIAPKTFSPCVTSTHLIVMMMEYLPQDMHGKRVLEIGTASGILTVHVIKNCHAITSVATEIDDLAFQDATENFKSNDISDQVQLVKDAEINSTYGTFDYILLNIVMAEMANEEEGFSDMVSASLSVHDALFKNLKDILNPVGRVCLAYASYGDTEGLEKLIEIYNLKITQFKQEEKFGVNWYYLELMV